MSSADSDPAEGFDTEPDVSWAWRAVAVLLAAVAVAVGVVVEMVWFRALLAR